MIGTHETEDRWRKKTISGLAWSAVSSLFKQILSFAVGVTMARLLSPAEFGLVGMVLIFSGLATLLVDQGMGAAIIQKKELEERHLDSIFCMNILFGALISGVLALASPLIASFYHEPVLQPLTLWISLNYLISSFSVVPNAVLSRRMEFKRLVLIDMIAVIGSGAIGIFMAFHGYGVWSLVWQTLTLAAFSVVMLFIASPWRPRLRCDRRSIREITGYSAHLMGFNLMNYFERNSDNFLIGKFLGAHSLGTYGKAYQFMLLPVNQVSGVISRVMFPALSSIKEDLLKVKRVYLRTIRSISYLTFPLMIGLLTVSRSFILGLLGEKWAEAAPILQVLCVTGLVQSINTTVGWIFNSQGRTDLQFRWSFILSTITVSSFVIGLHWGVMGVAVCYTAGELLMVYWVWSVPAKLIGLSFGEMLTNLSRTFFCAVVMGIFLITADHLLPDGRSYMQDLAVRVPMGAMFYCAVSWLFNRQALREVRETLRGGTGGK